MGEPKITREDAKQHLKRLDKIQDFLNDNFNSFGEESSILIDKEHLNENLDNVREALRSLL
jgi:hypothetical protein